MNSNGFNRQLSVRRAALIVYDILAVAASSALGLLMRFDMSYSELVNTYDADVWIDSLWQNLPILVISTIIIFYLFRMYHQKVLYTN